jgi:Pectate lyase superfamily protein
MKKIYNVKWFGALGNGVRNDRESIQSAIDFAETMKGGIIYFPKGTYMVDIIPYKSQINEPEGVCSLILKDNVEIIGEQMNGSIIKLMNHQGGKGTYGRIITSQDGDRLNNSGLKRITIDGNKHNQYPNIQFNNILLEAGNNINISETCHVNCNGNAVMVRGNHKISKIAKNIEISNNKIQDANHIGIQCAQFQSIKIESNLVNQTSDNSIDVYGDNGTIKTSSSQFLIKNNKCINGKVGIFCETVSIGEVTENSIQNCRVSGVAVNRIHGMPDRVNITKNIISNSQNGIIVSGDCEKIKISLNLIQNIKHYAFQLGVGDGNVSGVDIFMNKVKKSGSWLSIQGKQSSFITVKDNVITQSGKLKFKSNQKYKIFVLE